MKFNFKKITSVLASAVMLGSTIGIAAAANYPAPFISGGVADVSVVVGAASPNNVDYIAATDLGSSLSTELAAQTATGSGGSTASGGDSVVLTKGTDKLNMNDAITDVWTTAKLTDDNLKDLLADGTFRSKDNIDYKYEQYIQFFDTLNFTQFDDDDYKEDTPSLGIRVPTTTKVLNYTLDFSKDVRSDVVSERLEDMEDRDIIILGKTYKLLNAYNYSTYTKFELMRGAATDTINLNEEKTETVDDKSYTITLTFVDATYAQFNIVDSGGTSQTTTKLAKGGTYKLADGTQLGVTDISYQAFSGGVMSAEFTIGANKLTIEDTQTLEMDDTDINEITCYISKTPSGTSKEDVQKITLEWKTDEDEFVADGSKMVLPGFEALKIEYGGFVRGCEETVKVENTDDYGIELTVPIKDGDAKFGILNGNITDFTCVGRSKDCDKRFLRTGNATVNNDGRDIRFDRDTDDYFIASWNDSTNAESYLLKVSSISENDNKNYSTIQNIVTGSTWSNKQEGDTVTIGSVELTIGMVDKNNNFADLRINTDGTFNRIYTAGGLGIWLPVNNTEDTANTDYSTNEDGGIWNVLTNVSKSSTFYRLYMTEEDKNGNLGSGDIINITLDQTGGSSEGEPNEVVTQSGGWSDGNYREVGDTDVYEGYVASDLGTKINFKKPTSGANSLDVVYNCEQAYAEVYITAPETTISSGTPPPIGSITYYDNELTATAKAKNLIVVGGSCINTVAAELLGGSLCTAEFTDKTGVSADQFLVEVFDNPYTTGKVAMLVAGYEAADTKKAVTYVTKESPATAVGTKLKKVTATYADVA